MNTNWLLSNMPRKSRDDREVYACAVTCPTRPFHYRIAPWKSNGQKEWNLIFRVERCFSIEIVFWMWSGSTHRVMSDFKKIQNTAFSCDQFSIQWNAAPETFLKRSIASTDEIWWNVKHPDLASPDLNLLGPWEEHLRGQNRWQQGNGGGEMLVKGHAK